MSTKLIVSIVMFSINRPTIFWLDHPASQVTSPHKPSILDNVCVEPIT